MGTINFSVPDAVKRAFDKTFAGENKSGVLTGLMRQAIAERRRQKRRAVAIEALLRLRRRLPPVSGRELRKARQAGRP